MMETITKWPTKPLGTVAKIERNSVAPEDIRSGSLYVGLENITGSGGFDGVREVANGELASNKFVFTSDHVLYGKLRPYLSKIARPHFSGVCSTDILPLLPGKDVDRDYLFHFLRQPEMVQHATTRSTGANLPRLSPSELAQFEIPLPKLEEQKRIAAILDKADAIRRKRQEAFGISRTLIQSVFMEMFGEGIGSAIQGEPLPGWLIGTIDDIKASKKYSCIGGPFGSDLTGDDYVANDGVPVIRGVNLSDESPYMSEDGFVFVSVSKAEDLKKCHAHHGDILVSQRGARLAGQVGLIRHDSRYDKFIVSQSQMKLTPDTTKVDPMYLIFYLQSTWGVRETERRTISTGVPHINLGIFKSLPVYLPPMAIQTEFSRIQSQHEQALEQQNAALQMCDYLFNSLVQRAFKGEL